MFAGEFDRGASRPRQIALDQLTLLRFRFALVGAHIQVRMLDHLLHPGQGFLKSILEWQSKVSIGGTSPLPEWVTSGL